VEPDSDLFQFLCSTFRANGWAYEPVSGAAVVESGFEAHHGRVPLHVQAFPEIGSLSVVARTGFAFTDPDRRARVAELLMRVNTQLTLGSFDLRWEEGEPLFRISNLFPQQPEASMLTALVEIAVIEVDRLLPLLHRLDVSKTTKLVSLDLGAMLEEAPLPEVPPPPGAETS